ncbi:hypothetical protein NDU88_004093 [Pleurodeles waltl]|uniref:Uncharacterized protein n=1 Tax=Pleurodeles waltl TaxID=8319 RepID=A0AAV7TRH0_PLEWA|nr:hypothetical protein NDU88_004093 [Pleurodeles waltl]
MSHDTVSGLSESRLVTCAASLTEAAPKVFRTIFKFVVAIRLKRCIELSVVAAQYVLCLQRSDLATNIAAPASRLVPRSASDVRRSYK